MQKYALPPIGKALWRKQLSKAFENPNFQYTGPKMSIKDIRDPQLKDARKFIDKLRKNKTKQKKETNMAQQTKIGTHKTSIKSKDSKNIVITYHATDVITITPKTVIFNTGGYFTSTTKTRMNQACSQFGLGFSVYQKDHQWHVVNNKNGKVTHFRSNKLELLRHD